ncbi:MAG: hypothetical protein M0R70_08065 [Nitrospirae bacterium]|nr:hypothetical protein [Nitrospirota bacterium]
MNNNVRRWLITPIIVACLYWSFDGILYFASSLLPSIKTWIITKTICLPILSVVVFALIITTRTKSKKDILIIGFMATLAIWLLSSFYMLFMSAFSEKGMMPILGVAWLIIYFPMTAIMAATYSGGLWGLFATTIILPTATIILRIKPPKGLSE